jgi:hypothetical protein
MPKKKVLIIRRGLFGDTIVAIRALEYIRKYEASDIQIHYLSDAHLEKNYLTAKDVVGHLNLIDSFFNFRTFSNVKNFLFNFNLFFTLFSKYDKLVILECNYSSSSFFITKCKFLGILLGIKQIIYDLEIPRNRDNSCLYISSNLYEFISKMYF